MWQMARSAELEQMLNDFDKQQASALARRKGLTDPLMEWQHTWNDRSSPKNYQQGDSQQQAIPGLFCRTVTSFPSLPHAYPKNEGEIGQCLGANRHGVDPPSSDLPHAARIK